MKDPPPLSLTESKLNFILRRIHLNSYIYNLLFENQYLVQILYNS